VAKIKIIVQTIPIKEPGGVKLGKLIVSYQSIPLLVIRLPIAETKKTEIIAMAYLILFFIKLFFIILKLILNLYYYSIFKK
jgi:hypothetical protein